MTRFDDAIDLSLDNGLNPWVQGHGKEERRDGGDGLSIVLVRYELLFNLEQKNIYVPYPHQPNR